MAKPCLKCRRPNSDQAKKCIYCGAPFPEATQPLGVGERVPSPAQPTPAAPKAKPAPAREERPETFQVVISPLEGKDPKWLRPFCELTGFDPYLAKQRFKSVVPWVVRMFKEQDPAQEFLASLAQIGLDAYLVKQSGVDKLSGKLSAQGVRFGEAGVSFLTAAGEEVSVRYADLFVIVRGRIEQKPLREDEEENPVEVSLGGVIMGAAEREEDAEDPLVKLKQQARRIKIRRKKRPPMFYRRQSAEVMDVYLFTSHVGIRLVENEMDYSGLGERKQPAALLNFQAVFRDLVDQAPKLIVDENFNRISYVVKEVEDKDQVRTRLQEIGVSSSARKLYDNEASFTEYSSRIYLHYLRQAKLVKPI